jgi:hypothetical protein
MFTFSPNPANSSSTVKINFKEILTDDAVLTVYDSNGQLVKTLVCKGGSAFAELTISAKGIYIVNYHNSSKAFNQQLVVN